MATTTMFTTNLPQLGDTARDMSFGPTPIDFTPDFLKPNYRPLTLGEKISYKFRCPAHDFSRPSTDRETPKQVAYLDTFDSHQSCTKCGVQRFYRFRDIAATKTTPFMPGMTAGPLFVRTDVGETYNRQQGAFDVHMDATDYPIAG